MVSLTHRPQTPIGVWAWLVQADRVYADRYLARYFSIEEWRAAKGLPLGEYLTAVHPEDEGPLRQAIDTTASRGGHFHQIYRVKSRDDRWHRVIATGYCFKQTGDELSIFSGWLASADEVADGYRRRLAQMQQMTVKARSWTTDPAAGYVLDDVISSFKELLRSN